MVNFDGSTLELLKNIEAASSTGSPYMTYTTNGNYINLTCHTPLVRNLHIQENETSIDVSGLPEGNYFLHILLEEGKEPEVHKVVIAH